MRQKISEAIEVTVLAEAISSHSSSPSLEIDPAFRLLSLLYQSVEAAARRGEFFQDLKQQLGADVIAIQVRKLADGSVGVYRDSDGCDHEMNSVIESQPALVLNWDDSASRFVLNDRSLNASTDGDDSAAYRFGVCWANGEWAIQLELEQCFIHSDQTSAENALALTQQFGWEHRTLLRYLMPHFGIAHGILLKRQGADSSKLLSKIHNLLPTPLLVWDRRQHRAHPNTKALELINIYRDTEQNAHSPSLIEKTSKEGVPITGDWKVVHDATGVQLSLNDSECRPQLYCLSHLSGDPNYEVYGVGDGKAGYPSLHLDLLARCYRLTPAEANLCSYLIRGLSLQDCAVALQLSINTIKSRTKAIYRSCRVNSAAQLVVRLYFHPAHWAALTNWRRDREEQAR